jgi:nucleoid-associated protein YgaU
LTPALSPAVSDNAVTPYDRPASAVPQRDVANPKRAASIAVVAPAARTEQDRAVVVRRGDTLWSIAARALGDDARDAEVDSEWRRWFAANRNVIGSDPNLITPGMRLIAPTD